MTEPKDPPDDSTSEPKSAGEELREGLTHLFSAARKAIKSAEPAVTRSLDDAERVLGKIGRGGEVVAVEVSKEVASLASRLADKLKSVANRVEGDVPDERIPPDPSSTSESKPNDPDKT
jgi:hypothetical protein